MIYECETVYKDMPVRIKAFTVFQNGKYIIVLNSKLTHEQNIESFKHEIYHIENNDFDIDMEADFIELCSHRKP